MTVSTWMTFKRGAPCVQIQAAKDPERHYRLEDVGMSLPKWGNSCAWDAEDDQKLLLGCYW